MRGGGRGEGPKGVRTQCSGVTDYCGCNDHRMMLCCSGKKHVNVNESGLKDWKVDNVLQETATFTCRCFCLSPVLAVDCFCLSLPFQSVLCYRKQPHSHVGVSVYHLPYL